jgi:tetratricopeptide (TPR) repeat protein
VGVHGQQENMSDNSSTMLWDRVIEDFRQRRPASSAREDFFRPGVDRVAVVREALHRPGGINRMAAVALLKDMSEAEKKQLFPELIQLARSAHGPVDAVRNIILSLPGPWVLARIDELVEPFLAAGEYDDFWMMIELYERLDVARALALARRAALHPDEDVRELGLTQLSRLVARAGEDTPEADAVREAMGPAWSQPDKSLRWRALGLSQDLEALAEGKPRQVAMSPPQDRDYATDARLAFSAMNMGDVDLTLAFLRKPFPARLPSDAVLFLQARCWEKLGDEETALLFMREAERQNPAHTLSVLTVLQVLVMSGKAKPYAEELRRQADRIMDSGTSSPEDLYFAAISKIFFLERMTQGKGSRPTLEQAAAVLRRASSTFRSLRPEQQKIPDLDARIVPALGSCLEELGRQDEALALYESALADHPTDPDLLMFRGVAFLDTDPERALQDFAGAARAGVDSIWPYFFLAQHALTHDEFNEALKWASKAASKPGPKEAHAQAHEWVAIALSALSHPLDEVLEHFDRAIQLNPNAEHIRENRSSAVSESRRAWRIESTSTLQVKRDLVGSASRKTASWIEQEQLRMTGTAVAVA